MDQLGVFTPSKIAAREDIPPEVRGWLESLSSEQQAKLELALIQAERPYRRTLEQAKATAAAHSYFWGYLSDLRDAVRQYVRGRHTAIATCGAADAMKVAEYVSTFPVLQDPLHNDEHKRVAKDEAEDLALSRRAEILKKVTEISLPVPRMESDAPAQDQHVDRPAPNRKTQVEMFLESVGREAGREINKTDFWMVAGYSDQSEFMKWQRNDAKTTPGTASKFERVLQMMPAAFLSRLKSLGR